MNILGRGEEVSQSEILSILSSSIERYKLIEESENRRQNGNLFENGKKRKPKSSKDEKINKNDLWNLKINDLNEFSLQKIDSHENCTNQLKFLESVKNYILANYH
ncbi:uncharacterized protein TA12990 [Theileria annulata]|uniref:Uncharacterized protein n=1 Tax=Theileria annulata TaxID=5874 RepID=Q4UEA7_THEAN|nr:uncharacterized protein TA12990 [Theileria annulata]CAI74582.1 hypothetical protein TA12990 [Theileria annulata]|eukprot:XP_952314.1 hypothetical protein TA12990 [Theileria annulata]